MTCIKENWVYVKFCILLRKISAETGTLLTKDFKNKTQFYFSWDEYHQKANSCPPTSPWLEQTCVDKIFLAVLEDYRQTIDEISEIVSWSSCQQIWMEGLIMNLSLCFLLGSKRTSSWMFPWYAGRGKKKTFIFWQKL